MAKLWMLVPLVNMIAFFFVPIYDIVPDEKKMGKTKMFRSEIFWLLFFMMIASGASEQAVGQWASAFAETGLNISKTIGDLAGPCLFAFMQGTSRLIFGKYGERINLKKMMTASAVLCCICYLATSLSPYPVLSLVGCALNGFSVGIFWPGTFSIAAGVLPWRRNRDVRIPCTCWRCRMLCRSEPCRLCGRCNWRKNQYGNTCSNHFPCIHAGFLDGTQKA